MSLGTRPIVARIAAFVVLGISPAAVGLGNAEIVYSSPVYDIGTDPGLAYNLIPFVALPPPRDAPGRPAGPFVGNTITLGGTDRFLTTVSLGLWNTGTYTLSLYSGSDPNTGAFLGSASASGSNVSLNLNVLFNFDIVVPDTLTFIVSGIEDAYHGPLSGLAPTVGSDPNWLWFGPSPYGQNNVWATVDALPNTLAGNYLAAQFNTPEPDAVTLLVAMLLGLASWALLKKALA